MKSAGDGQQWLQLNDACGIKQPKRLDGITFAAASLHWTSNCFQGAWLRSVQNQGRLQLSFGNKKPMWYAFPHALGELGHVQGGPLKNKTGTCPEKKWKGRPRTDPPTLLISGSPDVYPPAVRTCGYQASGWVCKTRDSVCRMGARLRLRLRLANSLTIITSLSLSLKVKKVSRKHRIIEDGYAAC